MDWDDIGGMIGEALPLLGGLVLGPLFLCPGSDGDGDGGAVRGVSPAAVSRYQ
jgi:hypothetical protein